MKRIAIIYDRTIDLKEQNQVKTLMSQRNVTVFNSSELASILPTDKSKIIDDVFTQFLNLGDLNAKSVNLRDVLRHENTSWLYYHRFKLFFETQSTYLLRSEIIQLLPDYHEIIVYSNRHLLLQDYPNIKVNKGTVKPFSQSFILNFPYFFTAFVRFILSLFQSLTVRKCNAMVIEDPKHYQPVLKDDLCYHKANRFFHSYLDKTRDHLILDHLGIQKSQSFKISKSLFRFVNPNHKRLFSEWVIGSYLLNPFNWRLIFDQNRKHKSSKKILRDFGELTSNVLEKMMLDVLKRNTMSSFYFNLKYDAYKHFFKSKGIKVVLCVDENSPNNRAILDAAKFHNIYTVAYQHGSVHRLNPNYAYSRNDFVLNIVPDLTLVWDDYWYRFLLEKAHYPQDSVKVIGQLRMDNLQTLIESELVKAKRKEYSFKNILLFASQPLRDKKLENQVLKGLVQVCSSLEDTLLIFRPHPLEFSTQIFDELVTEFRYRNYLIDNQTDLYISIASADVVVTFFSTVGMEAKYFNKPLVIFDPLGQDPLGFGENGFATICQNEEMLRQELANVFDQKRDLSDRSFQKPMFKAVDRLVIEMNKKV